MVEKKPNENTNNREHYPVQEKKLTLGDIKRIVFLSYMFSQGESTLQTDMLKAVKAYYGAVDKYLNVKDLQTEPDIIKILSKLQETNRHVQLDDDNLPEVQEPEYSIHLFSEPYEYIDFRFISELILIRDQSYLCKQDGRPNRNMNRVGDNSLEDTYMSFFVNYIIRKNKTGDDAFDWIMKNCQIYLSTNYTKVVVKDLMVDILKKYNQTHPQTPVTKEELQKVGINIEI